MALDTAGSVAPLSPRLGSATATGLHAIAALFSAPELSREQDRTVPWVWLLGLMIAGAWLRLWGLGQVGLHGDEETMGLAVRHILIDGQPILPSGMFYPRGMTQLYLMAASVSLFGESEWALRLPSVLCGVALIALAYFAGRRFLRSEWSLAFAAGIAFLPDLILDSQTARMYIFLVTAIMGSMACLFAWERSGRVSWLIAATAVLMLGLDFHVLAVGCALMFFFPGLIRGDQRKLALGALAAVAMLCAFVIVNNWVESHYPTPPAEFAAERVDHNVGSQLSPELGATADALAALGAVLLLGAAVLVARTVSGRLPAFAAGMLLLTGAALQFVFFYHLAALCYAAGIVVALRFGAPTTAKQLIYWLVAAGALALVHVGSLIPRSGGSLMRLVGALIGQPSVWPYARIASFSTVAAALTGLLLAWGLFDLAQKRSATADWLLAARGISVHTRSSG